MATWLHKWRTSPARKGVGLVALLVVAFLLVEYIVLQQSWSVRSNAIGRLESNARLTTNGEARELSQLMNDLYVTTRTISMLPAVRRAPMQNRPSEKDDVVDGKRFASADAQTLLQLYLHLSDVMAVSEVYIVHDGFDPQRGEVPFLMFDSVILERFRKLVGQAKVDFQRAEPSGPDVPVEDESQEYVELVRLLDILRREHPSLPPDAPHGIANLVSSPIVTCDNSQFTSVSMGQDRDRMGLLLTVPIYDDVNGSFKGLVSTNVRLNVLEARLLSRPLVPVTAQEKAAVAGNAQDAAPLSDYVLKNPRSDVTVMDRRNQVLADVVAGRAEAGLSISVPLTGTGGAGWVLERHVPQAAYAAIDEVARRSAALGTLVNLLALIVLLAGGWVFARERRTSVRLKEIAEFDRLTGLPNRLQIDRAVEAGLRAAQRGAGHLTLVMVDLNNFKTVNDTLGHHVGDLLLIEVARRFQKQLNASVSAHSVGAPNPGRLVGRLGGDEFLVVLPDVGSERAVCRIAERMLSALAVPVIVDGHTLQVRASMGVALYPRHGKSAKQLLRNADQAMYAAKRQVDSAVVVYQRDIDHAALRRLRLEGDLRDALANGQFELHYQSIVSMATQRADGAEALLRWRHPELGLLLPAEFVPLLERSGMIVAVGRWVLRAASEQLLAWQQTGSRFKSVAVNVSVAQLAKSEFSAEAIELISKVGVDPQGITIEVTESVLMDKPERSIAQLQALRGAGMRVAIDDFGAGYASLGYLRRLPVDVMKIDRALLVDAATPGGHSILAAMVMLARELGLDCVVEGVETLAQHKLLFELGCPRMQGFLFSRPLPAAQADAAARRFTLPAVWSASELFTESCFDNGETLSGLSLLQ